MRIGELSRRTGVSVRMLRYYEQQGLLRPARTESGYRDYGAAEEGLARQVSQLHAAGLKLNVIAPLLPCLLRERAVFRPCAVVIARLQSELSAIDERIACLRTSRDLIAGLLDSANEASRR